MSDTVGWCAVRLTGRRAVLLLHVLLDLTGLRGVLLLHVSDLQPAQTLRPSTTRR